MNKRLLLSSNILLFISALIQALSGILFIFSVQSELLGDVHKYNGLVLAVLILIHVGLNWGWVKANLFRKARA